MLACDADAIRDLQSIKRDFNFLTEEVQRTTRLYKCTEDITDSNTYKQALYAYSDQLDDLITTLTTLVKEEPDP